jgi:hypothetical protein
MNGLCIPMTIVGRCLLGVVLSIVPALQVANASDESRLLPRILAGEAEADAQFLPDFSFAGFANGLADIPLAAGVVVHVKDHGAIPNDAKDDTKAVLAAIAHANSIAKSVIVRFESGRYRLSEVLRIERSDLVLQGAGSGASGTTLEFLRPLNQVDKSDSLVELRQYLVKLDKRQIEPDNNLDEYFSEYSWSGGFIWVQKPGTRPAAYLEEYDPDINVLAEIQVGERGKQTITVSDSARLSVGDVVQVQWVNREGPGAGIIKSLYGSQSGTAGSHHWTFPRRPLVKQSTRVLSIDGNTLTLADPLLHDANGAIPAQVAEWAHLQQVGIEDLHIEFPMSPYFGHHMERGYNGIYLTSAYDSWVRNVRISNADSGILTYNSANITLRDIVTDGQRKAHYAVHMGNVHNVLAERVTIKNPVLHSLTFNTQSTKCVYKDAQVFVQPTLDQHAGSNHQNLFDNVTLYAAASKSGDGAFIPIFDGSGAGYWQPGHGGFNTTWNLRVLVTGGAYPEEVVSIQGLDEGPMARIIGLHGNREFSLDYRPAPYVEKLNVELRAVPSLYEYQLSKRIGEATRSD